MSGNRLSEARYLMTVTDHFEMGESAAEVAFVGRSNVGKSTILNALCRQKQLARTSQTPGKTRTINVFSVTHGRWLVDLPGYGFARGPEAERQQWPAMIEGYLLNRPSLRMVFVLVDAFVGATKLDLQMCDWLTSHALPFRIIANKTDKVKAASREENLQAITGVLGIPASAISLVSAKKDLGIRELRTTVEQILMV